MVFTQFFRVAPNAAAWNHDMFGSVDQSGRPSGIETGTRLYVSTLDYGVSNEDIKELCSEVDDLKKYSINYDRSGRSKVNSDEAHIHLLSIASLVCY
ncbi:putative nucleotide-binding alpha-beta plait domain superfamily, RNA-binding domain superfamily [Helianthus annuus]|nr:putative nucleotide-binding alpha-beta plait domain superfamily, RNA-binding domain superfamily [Helianthus annuus]